MSAAPTPAVRIVEDTDRTLTYEVLGVPIRVRKVLDEDDFVPLFADGCWDVFLWDCSVVMGNVLSRWCDDPARALKGKRVIELGAGWCDPTRSQWSPARALIHRPFAVPRRESAPLSWARMWW